MHITEVDFSDFVAIGVSGFAVTASIAAFFYRAWGKEKESRLLVEEKLQEEEISKNLSHVADIVKQVDEIVTRQAKTAFQYSFPNGEVVWAVNSQNFPSETAQEIMTLKDCQIAVVYYETENFIFFSVRSRDNSALELAKAYQGGGHHKSAGLTIQK